MEGVSLIDNTKVPLNLSKPYLISASSIVFSECISLFLSFTYESPTPQFLGPQKVVGIFCIPLPNCHERCDVLGVKFRKSSLHLSPQTTAALIHFHS